MGVAALFLLVGAVVAVVGYLRYQARQTRIHRSLSARPSHWVHLSRRRRPWSTCLKLFSQGGRRAELVISGTRNNTSTASVRLLVLRTTV